MDLEKGDICLHESILGEFEEVIFLRYPDEPDAPTGIFRRDERDAYLLLKRIKKTGKKAKAASAAPEKKKGWTLGVDPIPDHAFKKGRKK